MNTESIFSELIEYLTWLAQALPTAIQAFFSELGLA